jgi:hypothetical protein
MGDDLSRIEQKNGPLSSLEHDVIKFGSHEAALRATARGRIIYCKTVIERAASYYSDPAMIARVIREAQADIEWAEEVLGINRNKAAAE